MSDTPLTDIIDRRYYIGADGWSELLRHARSLERRIATIREQTIEEAAKVCHRMAVDQRIHPLASRGAFNCAAAIRAMK